MRILDENDKELTQDQVDLSVGYLVNEQVFKEHHDAVAEIAEQGHYYPKAFYFNDNTKYVVDEDWENDAHVKKNSDVSFSYVPDGGEEREQTGCDVAHVIDVEHQDAKDAYDEMEDIQRYKLYTEEELVAKKAAEEKQKKEAEFLDSGPDRLTSAESDLNDITMTIADMIGV